MDLDLTEDGLRGVFFVLGLQHWMRLMSACRT